MDSYQQSVVNRLKTARCYVTGTEVQFGPPPPEDNDRPNGSQP